jgi:hypothetical protein
MAVQWVNLSRLRDEYDGEKLPGWLSSIDGLAVTSHDRLGPQVRVRLRFQRPGRESFVVRLKPGCRRQTKVAHHGYQPSPSKADLQTPDWAPAYSQTEVAHHGYQLSPSKADLQTPDWTTRGLTDEDGTKIVEGIRLTAAGGEVWSVEARDTHGTQKESAGCLETRRGVFVLPMIMEKVTAPDITSAAAAFRPASFHIKVLPAIRTPYARFLPRTDSMNAVIEKYKASARDVVRKAKFESKEPASEAEPYLVCCGFYDMSPARASVDFTMRFRPGPVLQMPLVRNEAKWLLWINVDETKDWLEQAQIEVVDANGRSVWQGQVPPAAITPMGSDDAGYTGITIEARKIVMPQMTGCTLHVKVRAKVIKGGINGFSSGAQGNGSLIAVCTRHAYKARQPGELAQTLVHELGHKINLVPPGDRTMADPKGFTWGGRASGRYLDAVPAQYFGRGHQGSHCHTGYTPTNETEPMTGKSGTCVMFGENGISRTGRFCGDCTTRLRKIDVSEGWAAF